MISAKEIIEKLQLTEHPEGGYFNETYRSDVIIKDPKVGKRAASTAIYYMLTTDTFSEMHRLSIDEIFHFYLGDPVEMLHLYADGKGEKVIFGNDLIQKMSPQVIVPAGVWQGARILPGGSCGFSLMGTTVAPGFEYSDYQSGGEKELTRKYPSYEELISHLTKNP